MIIVPSATINLSAFSDVRDFSTGLSLDVAKYTIIDNSFEDGIVVSNQNYNEIQTNAQTNFKSGESVIVKIGNYSFSHIIVNAGDGNRYLLKESVRDSQNKIYKSGSIQVKRNTEKRVKFNDLDEGYYIIDPLNLKLVVRKSFVQPFISLTEVSAKLIDATNLREHRLKIVQELALKLIYAKLSNYDNYFDIVDEVDFWALLFHKTLCILSEDGYKIDNKYISSCLEFEKIMKSYSPKAKIKADSTGKPIGNIPTTLAYTTEWSL